jgi:hypothetical protein
MKFIFVGLGITQRNNNVITLLVIMPFRARVMNMAAYRMGQIVLIYGGVMQMGWVI